MSIGKHFTCDVVTVNKDEDLKAAAQLLFEKNTGSVVVLENEKPVGILSDRDILSCYLQEEQSVADLQVADVIEANLLTVKTTDGIQDALDAMAEKGVRRAPVVDEQEKLVGLVTTDDVVKILAEEFSKLSEIMHCQEVVLH